MSFTASMSACKNYFNEGLNAGIGSQPMAACNVLAVQKGIPRPGSPAWAAAHKKGGALFYASANSCKSYFNKGLSRTTGMNAQAMGACDLYASKHGIARPGTNRWKMEHPELSGGRTRRRRGTRKQRKTRSSRR
jgi:hypothetical protein